MKIMTQMAVLLIQLHQFHSSHLLRLIQRLEGDLRRWFSCVGEWTLDGIEIVSTHGDDGTFTSDVVMQFILQIDEAVVGILRECDSTQHCSHSKGTHLLSLLLYDQPLHRLRFDWGKVRDLHLLQKHEQTGCQTFQTQQIVTVCRNIYFVDDFF